MSRTPDFVLKAWNKTTRRYSSKLGAAWVNDNGSITIVLDPGVALSGGEDVSYPLFKWDEKEVRNQPRRDHPEQPDDVPF